MQSRRIVGIVRIGGIALIASAAVLPVTAGVAGASNTVSEVVSNEPVERATIDRTQLESATAASSSHAHTTMHVRPATRPLTTAQKMERLLESVHKGTADPKVAIKQLTFAAHEATKLGLDAQAAAYFAEAVTLATAEWKRIAQHSTNLEELVAAGHQAALLGDDEAASTLWTRTVDLAKKEMMNAAKNSNDPLKLLGFMVQAEKLGLGNEAGKLRDKLDVLAGGNFYAPKPGSPVALAAQAVNGGNGGNSGSMNPGSTHGGSTGNTGNTGNTGSNSTPGPSHNDPDAVPGANNEGASGGSSNNGSSSNGSAVPSNATQTGSTREPTGDTTTNADGTTTQGYYTSSETYRYKGDDGKEHERTVKYDKDGNVTWVSDAVVDDAEGDGRCAEDGCGNQDTAAAGADTAEGPNPACLTDACNTGDPGTGGPTGTGGGGDEGEGVPPTSGPCGPTAYYDGECSVVGVLPTPDAVTPTTSEACAADGCPRPDLATPPSGDLDDIPGWEPYAHDEP